MDNRIERLIEALLEDVRDVYKVMLPEFQQSYADYVYSAEKEITIFKRKKHLEKSFRKLLTEVYFYLTPMSQRTAEEIANDWKYEPPYDFYDMTADPEDYAEILSPEARGDNYFQVVRNGQLVGFATFLSEGSELEIGLGMKPAFIGQGWGRDFFKAIENFAKEKYEAKTYVLRVAAFNARAQHLYQEMGYQIIENHQQLTNGASYPFVKMVKTL